MTRRAFAVTPLSLTTIDFSISVSQLCSGASAPDVAKSSEKNEHSYGLSVYPNPVKDVLHVEVNGKALFSLINFIR